MNVKNANCDRAASSKAASCKKRGDGGKAIGKNKTKGTEIPAMSLLVEQKRAHLYSDHLFSSFYSPPPPPPPPSLWICCCHIILCPLHQSHKLP